ncbi:LytR/AlgR family response regulator transcription factor [Flavobacterium kingsejongi]|uniref:DNA-binding response regulator n=1 Tax=Flavobacterium kingsejongi TaxID=1678728 RepID=A0A2S1LKQ0_9FLAO|nr:LytTR family DNA-binding domain-containing protein [Flavobacterium kingsejongi]AWG24251.1 DNA-binding response regulator [Flavobacterium kingsejongi]
MIRCLTVDDEAYASQIIAAFIEKTPFLELAGTTTSALEALQWIHEGKVDLVFLDIQMPELTGIQMLKIIGGKCKVILTTAYPDYALEGYELDVIDYLMKPISFERFLRGAQKAQELLAKTVVLQPEPENLMEPEKYLFVKGNRKNMFHKVEHEDILFVEGLKNYVRIHTPNERIVTYQTLQYLGDKLPMPPFFRVHRSFIISVAKIQHIDGNSLTIGNQIIPIGESYRESFFEFINGRM